MLSVPSIDNILTRANYQNINKNNNYNNVHSHLLHALGGHAHADPVADVEAQRFAGAVFVEPYPPVRLGQDVYVDYGRDLPEVLRETNHEARLVLLVGGARGIRAEPRQAQPLLPSLERVGGKHDGLILWRGQEVRGKGLIIPY